MYVESTITVSKSSRWLMGMWIGLMVLLMTKPAAAQHSQIPSVVVINAQKQQDLTLPMEVEPAVNSLPEAGSSIYMRPVQPLAAPGPVSGTAWAIEQWRRPSRSQRFVEAIKENKYLAIGAGVLTVSVVAILASGSGGGTPEPGITPLPMPAGRPGS
ncbi:hypothetical protein ACFSVN_04900 [Gracilimonas halophila]|uniref:Uncharacterized protein n=1 Tax=Gracilimonas halophila TaxID=1834464 RepID=A0ABW5JHL0_9BACT